MMPDPPAVRSNRFAEAALDTFYQFGFKSVACFFPLLITKDFFKVFVDSMLCRLPMNEIAESIRYIDTDCLHGRRYFAPK